MTNRSAAIGIYQVIRDKALVHLRRSSMDATSLNRCGVLRPLQMNRIRKRIGSIIADMILFDSLKERASN